MSDFSQLNFLAILVAVIINQVLGAFWYSVLFGKAWMKEVGINEKDINKKEATKGFILALVFAIIAFMVIALIIQYTGADSLSKGIIIGILLGILVAVPMATNYTYENRSQKLFFINAFYPIISYTIGSAILAVW